MSKADSRMQRRQEILDYLIEHSWSSGSAIGGAVGLSKSSINSYLREMSDAGEVGRCETFSGRVSHVTYVARATKTAADIPVQRTTSRGGVVHKGTEREHPLPNSGGQGALRYEFGIQSSAGLL